MVEAVSHQSSQTESPGPEMLPSLHSLMIWDNPWVYGVHVICRGQPQMSHLTRIATLPPWVGEGRQHQTTCSNVTIATRAYTGSSLNRARPCGVAMAWACIDRYFVMEIASCMLYWACTLGSGCTLTGLLHGFEPQGLELRGKIPSK